jgi:capsular exopolysaccharide synthesis family protein
MAEDDTDLDLRGISGLVRRQIRLIATTMVLVLGLSALWIFSLTPLYTASALILIDPASSNLLDAATRTTQAATDNARVASEVEILRSEATALAVVEAGDLVSSSDFGVQISLYDRARAFVGLSDRPDPDPQTALHRVVRRFSETLQVERRGLTYLVAVRVTSPDPSRAADLANLTAGVYIDAQVAAKVGSALTARDTIQSRLAEADSELVASERAFNTFIEENLTRIELQTGRSDLSRLRTELERLRDDSSLRRVAANTASLDLQQRDWASLVQTLRDDTLAALERQQAELRGDLADATAERAIDLRAELDALDARLASRADVALADLRAELASLDTQVDQVQSDLRASVLNADLPPEILGQVFSLQQRGTLARNQYQTLLSRLRDFEAQAELQIADARLVSPALPPIDPSFPNSGLMLALTLFAATGLGVTLGVMREFYIGGFVSDLQAADVLGVPIVATIPRLDSSGNEPADEIAKAPMSIYAESMRRLRASLDQRLHMTNARTGFADNRPGTILMIASTVPAEGKTTCALSLARTYALSGKRTLLIDCDLRKPSIAPNIGRDIEYGLLDYLSALAPDASADSQPLSLDSIMQADPQTSLDLICSTGRSPRPTDQLLSSENFTQLLNDMRDQYDMIVLDTPPMLPVVDGRYLAPHADALVLVLKWAETRQQDARRTVAILRETAGSEVPIVGILNQQDMRGGKYYYQGYYGYEG